MPRPLRWPARFAVPVGLGVAFVATADFEILFLRFAQDRPFASLRTGPSLRSGQTRWTLWYRQAARSREILRRPCGPPQDDSSTVILREPRSGDRRIVSFREAFRCDRNGRDVRLRTGTTRSFVGPAGLLRMTGTTALVVMTATPALARDDSDDGAPRNDGNDGAPDWREVVGVAGRRVVILRSAGGATKDLVFWRGPSLRAQRARCSAANRD